MLRRVCSFFIFFTLTTKAEEEASIVWCSTKQESKKERGVLWILGKAQAVVDKRDEDAEKLGMVALAAAKRIVMPEKAKGVEKKEYEKAQRNWEKSEKDLEKALRKPSPETKMPKQHDIDSARLQSQGADSGLKAEAKRIVLEVLCPCDSNEINVLMQLIQKEKISPELAHQLAVAAEEYSEAKLAAKELYTHYMSLPRLQRKSAFEVRPLYAPFLYGRPRRLHQVTPQLQKTTNELIIALRTPQQPYIQRHLGLIAVHTAEYIRNLTQADPCRSPEANKLCTPAEMVLHANEAIVRKTKLKYQRARRRVDDWNAHGEAFLLNSSLVRLSAHASASTTALLALQDIKRQHDEHAAMIQAATMTRDQALRALRSLHSQNTSIPPLAEALKVSHQADAAQLSTQPLLTAAPKSNNDNSSHFCLLPTATPLPFNFLRDQAASLHELPFSNHFRLLQLGSGSCDPSTTLFDRTAPPPFFEPDWAIAFDCQVYNKSIPPTHALVDEPAILLLRDPQLFGSGRDILTTLSSSRTISASFIAFQHRQE